MEKVINEAKEKGLKIIPVCSYAVSYFEKNPEYKELLNIIKKALLPLASMIVVVLILEYFIGPLFTTRILMLFFICLFPKLFMS